jgi:hypothetical protein
MLSADEASAVFAGHDARSALESLARRGLAYRSPESGRVHALSRLVRHLM